MAVTTGLRQFFMLWYKGLILRKRHYIITALQVIVPVLLSSIAVIIQSEFVKFKNESSSQFDYDKGNKDEVKRRTNATTYEAFDPFSGGRGSYGSTMQFLYSPNNETVQNMMNETIALWKKNTKYRYELILKGFKDEETLENYAVHAMIDSYSADLIGTIFNNFNSDSLPESLDYKLRFPNRYDRFQTKMKYKYFGPNKYTEYKDSYFLSWQAAIEETFINKKMVERGTYLDYKMMMQMFPYPEFVTYTSELSPVNSVPWFLGFGLLIFGLDLIRRVVEEKANGSKELLKMMGMTDFIYWSSTFTNCFSLAAVIIFIISILYKVPFRYKGELLPNSDFFLLLIILLLCTASFILFCLAISTFFNRPTLAVIVLLILHSVSLTLLATNFFLVNVTAYFALEPIQKLSICLLPAGALLTIFFIYSSFESSGDGVTWSNLTEATISPDLNMAMIMAMVLLSCLFYSIIIWYVDAVWPWQYGIPKPLYFPFTKNYWCGGSDAKEVEDCEEPIEQNAEFFEKDLSTLTPGIIINNLTKQFRVGLQQKVAVNNLCLKIYRGQITALLGHNGAGKTTTINILTGLYTPTKGSATINGWDILTQTTKARRSLGVCPQNSILYDTLTVDEHLKIFAGLKGVCWKNLASQSSDVMDLLRLTDKKNEIAKNLSGGMRRKLSLGIALIGDSEVLFLDEPTSGMDVEARRLVWDALLEIRHDRTIILTTHYMEEADVLGDKVAIMAEGQVQCYGSPIFLKRKFGTGYHLHLVKNENFNLEAATALLQKYIPEAHLENDTEKDITFNLSSGSEVTFGPMFKELETQKQNLGYNSCGITVTTMEDVFLNVANYAERKQLNENDTIVEMEVAGEDDNVFSGQKRLAANIALMLNKLRGLLVKRLRYSLRHWGILIAQLILPFIIITLLLYSLSASSGSSSVNFQPLKLDLASIYGNTKGFYEESPDPDAMSFLENNLKPVYEKNSMSVTKAKNATDYILEFGKESLSAYLKSLMIGGSAEKLGGKLTLTAWFNNEAVHTPPISLNLFHAAILRSITGSGSITLTNAPLPHSDRNFYDDSEKMMERILAAVLVPLALIFLSASFVLVPIQEKSSRAKLMQIMTGISPMFYWFSMLLWDALVHTIIIMILLVPFAIFGWRTFYLYHPEAIGTVLLLLLLHGWSCIPLSYLASLLFKKPNAGFSFLIVLGTVTGLICGSMIATLTTSIGANDDVNTASWFLRLHPSFCISLGFSKLFAVATTNSFCDKLTPRDLELNCDPGFRNKVFKCCKDICGDSCLKQTYPITFGNDGCSPEMLMLFLDGVLFLSLLFFFETKLAKLMWRKLKSMLPKFKNQIPGHCFTAVDDSEVEAEEKRIKQMGGHASESDALTILNLTKHYGKILAVDHLTFGVHHEECFGLLGVNGAGKTTTFKMLTGDIIPTDGNAFFQNCTLLNDLKKFQSFIGYCPQYDALIDRLSGREMLTLFARLRGYASTEVKCAVNKLIRMIDLEKHADKQTQFYSGGNKRKLSLGLALIGAPPLLLLDEPTAGVDPVSRRKIWKILTQARSNTGAAVILTTHSMEECEALCSRLAIMVNGKFRCLGSIQQLKTKYGRGYSVIIKLKKEVLEKDVGALNNAKEYFTSNIAEAHLKDDHQGMLQYHVTDTSMTLSRLFTFMHKMKDEMNLEDYLISDTSLEQIFLAFARAQIVVGEQYV